MHLKCTSTSFNKAWATYINQKIPIIIAEFSQFIYRVLGILDCGAQLDATATFHRSCHMTRLLGERTAPFVLLDHVKDLEMIPLHNVQLCCGFGGTFSAKEPINIMIQNFCNMHHFDLFTPTVHSSTNIHQTRLICSDQDLSRELGEQIRQHAVKHLPDYLEEFSENVQKNGGHVYFAKTDGFQDHYRPHSRSFEKLLALDHDFCVRSGKRYASVLRNLVKMSKKMADTFILPRQMLMQPLISNKLYVRKISKRSLNQNRPLLKLRILCFSH